MGGLPRGDLRCDGEGPDAVFRPDEEHGQQREQPQEHQAGGEGSVLAQALPFFGGGLSGWNAPYQIGFADARLACARKRFLAVFFLGLAVEHIEQGVDVDSLLSCASQSTQPWDDFLDFF